MFASYTFVLHDAHVMRPWSAEKNEGEDDEDKEEDRQAKRFAKRARMNRILEAYEGDDQFSRSRLIDEDASLQIELKSIKVNISQCH